MPRIRANPKRLVSECGRKWNPWPVRMVTQVSVNHPMGTPHEQYIPVPPPVFHLAEGLVQAYNFQIQLFNDKK